MGEGLAAYFLLDALTTGLCMCALLIVVPSMLFIMPVALWASADCIIGIRPCVYKYLSLRAGDLEMLSLTVFLHDRCR